MPAKALIGEYSQKYHAYSRPVSTESLTEHTRRDKEALLFNETLHDFLWGYQSRKAHLDEAEFNEAIEALSIDAKQVAASGIEPERFDLQKVSDAFRGCRISAINTGMGDNYRKFLVVAQVQYKALSPVEREFIAAAMDGQVEIDLGMVSWRVTELVVSIDVPESAVHSWMLREYLLWCWWRLELVVAEAGEKLQVPLRVRLHKLAVQLGLIRRPVWTHTEEFSINGQ